MSTLHGSFSGLDKALGITPQATPEPSEQQQQQVEDLMPSPAEKVKAKFQELVEEQNELLKTVVHPLYQTLDKENVAHRPYFNKIKKLNFDYEKIAVLEAEMKKLLEDPAVPVAVLEKKLKQLSASSASLRHYIAALGSVPNTSETNLPETKTKAEPWVDVEQSESKGKGFSEAEIISMYFTEIRENFQRLERDWQEAAESFTEEESVVIEKEMEVMRTLVAREASVQGNVVLARKSYHTYQQRRSKLTDKLKALIEKRHTDTPLQSGEEAMLVPDIVPEDPITKEDDAVSVVTIEESVPFKDASVVTEVPVTTVSYEDQSKEVATAVDSDTKKIDIDNVWSEVEVTERLSIRRSMLLARAEALEERLAQSSEDQSMEGGLGGYRIALHEVLQGIRSLTIPPDATDVVAMEATVASLKSNEKLVDQIEASLPIVEPEAVVLSADTPQTEGGVPSPSPEYLAREAKRLELQQAYKVAWRAKDDLQAAILSQAQFFALSRSDRARFEHSEKTNQDPYLDAVDTARRAYVAAIARVEALATEEEKTLYTAALQNTLQKLDNEAQRSFEQKKSSRFRRLLGVITLGAGALLPNEMGDGGLDDHGRNVMSDSPTSISTPDTFGSMAMDPSLLTYPGDPRLEGRTPDVLVDPADSDARPTVGTETGPLTSPTTEVVTPTPEMTTQRLPAQNGLGIPPRRHIPFDMGSLGNQTLQGSYGLSGLQPQPMFEIGGFQSNEITPDQVSALQMSPASEVQRNSPVEIEVPDRDSVPNRIIVAVTERGVDVEFDRLIDGARGLFTNVPPVVEARIRNEIKADYYEHPEMIQLADADEVAAEQNMVELTTPVSLYMERMAGIKRALDSGEEFVLATGSTLPETLTLVFKSELGGLTADEQREVAVEAVEAVRYDRDALWAGGVVGADVDRVSDSHLIKKSLFAEAIRAGVAERFSALGSPLVGEMVDQAGDNDGGDEVVTETPTPAEAKPIPETSEAAVTAETNEPGSRQEAFTSAYNNLLKEYFDVDPSAGGGLFSFFNPVEQIKKLQFETLSKLTWQEVNQIYLETNEAERVETLQSYGIPPSMYDGIMRLSRNERYRNLFEPGATIGVILLAIAGVESTAQERAETNPG